MKVERLMITMLLVVILAGCAGGRGAAEPSLPVAADEKVELREFIIGVGDSVEITVYRQDELKKSVKIDPTGVIMFPLIGDVTVAGKGVFRLRDELQERLSKYIVGPQVSVSVTSVQSRKFMVLGEVRTPGVYTFDSDLDVMEGIMRAGGYSNDAKLSNVILVRSVGGRGEVTSVDLTGVGKGRVLADIPLRSGDVIYVPARKIASVARYFGYLSQILSPIVSLESGIVLWPQVTGVMEGKSSEVQISVPTN
jgi:polysaccharide export outer membrane protein